MSNSEVNFELFTLPNFNTKCTFQKYKISFWTNRNCFLFLPKSFFFVSGKQKEERDCFRDMQKLEITVKINRLVKCRKIAFTKLRLILAPQQNAQSHYPECGHVIFNIAQ